MAHAARASLTGGLAPLFCFWRPRAQVEVLEYPELGMEAIWKIEVENFPAFIVVDDKGNDFFSNLQRCPVA